MGKRVADKAPLRGCYRRGRRFEYRVRDRLCKHGYFVMRSPASKSPIDLVALRPNETVLVQCKIGGAMGVQEWNEFFDLAISLGAIPILAATVQNSGIDWFRLTGRKDGSKQRQPMTEWTPPISTQSTDC